MPNGNTHARSWASLFVPHMPARYDCLIMLNRNTHGAEAIRGVVSGSEPARAQVCAAKRPGKDLFSYWVF